MERKSTERRQTVRKDIQAYREKKRARKDGNTSETEIS
jgi:hypothetical protein